ncbi:MAG TPA: ATP-binding protein [Candidatus Obscuribacterales bacterium]
MDIFANNKAFKLAFEQAPIGMAIAGPDFRFLKANDTFCRLTGYSEKELLQRTFVDITHPDDVEIDVSKAEEIFLGTSDCYQLETRYIRKDGRTVWIVLTVTTLAVEDKVFSLGMVMDISERKRKELSHRQSLLQQQQEDFVAMLNHDLRVPMLGCNRILELLCEDNVTSEEQKRLLHQLLKSNRELTAKMQKILKVYKFEEELSRRTWKEVNACDVARQTICRMRAQAQAKQIEIAATIAENPIVIRGDGISFQELISNLIDNAIKFSEPQARVEIKVEQCDNEMVLSVSDYGAGINPSLQNLMFARLWQGGEGGYSSSTGLGLYFCKKIVDAHNGVIQCQSAPGEGSTFVVKIPLIQAVTADGRKKRRPR